MDNTQTNEALRIRACVLRVSKAEIARGIGKSRKWVTDYLNGASQSRVLGVAIKEYLDEYEEGLEAVA